MVFVIVVMGILAKFGAEIFRNIYQNYINSTANNELQSDTELVLQQIGNRLQYRIKESVIARRSNGDFDPLTSVTDSNYTAFEWIGYDIDGWLGNGSSTKPAWTGFIDVDAIDTANADEDTLFSPESNTTAINNIIAALSPSAAGIGNAAIFFTGENSDVRTDYDWNNATGQLTTQSNVASHRIQAGANIQQFDDATGADFNGTDIYEQYQLSWTAYALELVDGNLTLYYDYRPWDGENYVANGTPAVLMQNVSTTKLRIIGDMINIQVCISENNITGSEYSICKEKAIF